MGLTPCRLICSCRHEYHVQYSTRTCHVRMHAYTHAYIRAWNMSDTFGAQTLQGRNSDWLALNLMNRRNKRGVRRKTQSATVAKRKRGPVRSSLNSRDAQNGRAGGGLDARARDRSRYAWAPQTQGKVDEVTSRGSTGQKPKGRRWTIEGASRGRRRHEGLVSGNFHQLSVAEQTLRQSSHPHDFCHTSVSVATGMASAGDG